MQSLLPKDDEPIRPIQPPQPQQAPQAAPPQGYNYPPQNYPPPNYPPPELSAAGLCAAASAGSRELCATPASVRIEFEDYDSDGSRRGIDRRVRISCIYQLNEVKRAGRGDQGIACSAEIEKIHETSSVTVQTSRRNIRGACRRTFVQVPRAGRRAERRGENRSQQACRRNRPRSCEKAQAEQGQKIDGVTAEVSQVKDVAAATSTKVGEVTNEVGTLKTETASNKSAIEKTIADLKSARGDLGVQSGLIATNGKEFTALKQLGETQLHRIQGRHGQA